MNKVKQFAEKKKYFKPPEGKSEITILSRSEDLYCKLDDYGNKKYPIEIVYEDTKYTWHLPQYFINLINDEGIVEICFLDIIIENDSNLGSCRYHGSRVIAEEHHMREHDTIREACSRIKRKLKKEIDSEFGKDEDYF